MILAFVGGVSRDEAAQLRQQYGEGMHFANPRRYSGVTGSDVRDYSRVLVTDLTSPIAQDFSAAGVTVELLVQPTPPAASQPPSEGKEPVAPARRRTRRRQGAVSSEQSSDPDKLGEDETARQ